MMGRFTANEVRFNRLQEFKSPRLRSVTFITKVLPADPLKRDLFTSSKS